MLPRRDTLLSVGVGLEPGLWRHSLQLLLRSGEPIAFLADGVIWLAVPIEEAPSKPNSPSSLESIGPPHYELVQLGALRDSVSPLAGTAQVDLLDYVFLEAGVVAWVVVHSLIEYLHDKLLLADVFQGVLAKLLVANFMEQAGHHHPQRGILRSLETVLAMLISPFLIDLGYPSTEIADVLISSPACDLLYHLNMVDAVSNIYFRVSSTHSAVDIRASLIEL